MWNRLKLTGLVLLLCLPARVLPATQLDQVGSATLKVFFWTIYDSRLYSPDGDYDGVEPGLALEITYRRDISAEDLVDRTRREWRKLDLYQQVHENWLSELQGMWPGVAEDDTLTLQVDEELHSRFYLNGNFLGKMASSQFTGDFLAIWLSENSSYPRLRDQLVGMSD